MALAKFKVAFFDTPLELQAFVNTGDVSSVISVVSDANGKYVLFYLTA